MDNTNTSDIAGRNERVQKMAFRSAIFNCSRCGKDHTNLLFIPFKTPDGTYSPMDATHHSICSTTNEPILVKKENDKDFNRNGSF